MTNIAADIVLLPPPRVMRQIAGMTAGLPADPTRLNTSDCLPHMTLAMGLLDTTKIVQASELLDDLAARHTPFMIRLTEANSYKTPDDRTFSQLLAETHEELVALHYDILETFRSLMAPGDRTVTSDMFLSPPEVAPISNFWVQRYFTAHPAGFRPHITLGASELTVLPGAIEFPALRLAICHFGTYCTCRKILHETALR